MPGTRRPRVTVVVVNYNGGDFLAECLASLELQEVPGVDVEVVVVDNDSHDGSEQIVERDFPPMRLIRSGANLGFAGGVNRGIRESQGDVVVLINNDAVAEPGFVAALTAPLLEPGSPLAATTGRIVLSGRFVPAPNDPDAYVAADGHRMRRLGPGEAGAAGEVLLNSTGLEVLPSGNGRDRSWLDPVAEATGVPAEVFGFCGGASALRRDALDDAGMLDERLFMYYEDLDLSWRFRRRGWEIAYVADAVTIHRHAASSGVHSRLFLLHNARNRLLVTLRNGPPRMRREAVARTLLSLFRSALQSIRPGSAGAPARARAAATAAALRSAARLAPAFRRDGRADDTRAARPRDFVTDWFPRP